MNWDNFVSKAVEGAMILAAIGAATIVVSIGLKSALEVYRAFGF